MLRQILQCLVLVALFVGNVQGQDKQPQFAALFDSLKNFNGSVLISHQGKLLFQKAYGIADQSTNRQLTTESVFELASVSKAFTGIGIMQLKEKGLLSYDDSLRKFFPELPYAGVSVRHLLANTSGIPDFLGWTEEEINVNAKNTNAAILGILPKKFAAVAFAPGLRFLYSNTNYVLLASIIEKVSGLSYAEYMRKHIFLPCGMSNTVVSPRYADKLPKDYAFDYAWDGSENRFLPADSLKRYIHYLSGVTGAFGVISNTADLYKWCRALNTNLLVSEATKKEALSPVKLASSGETAGLYPGLPYVFGWQLLEDPPVSGDMFSSGNYGGYRSLVVNKVSQDQIVIILCNMGETSDVISLMNSVEEIFEGAPVSPPDEKEMRKGIKLSSEQMRALQGTYTTKDGTFPPMKIRCIGNRLYAKFGETMEQNIFPESADTFFVTGTDGKVIFNRNNQGAVISLSLNGAGMSQTFFLNQ
ncbi:serine hydrolase [Dyadobacter sp. Leaf189]|uniref:serine hydrolase domain-containing protein n=1 Tax=Dyadobacter sp. Leaf189 TaxID=1736295 RepID=UPI0006FF1854|nr:serine hydrolase domain-containing protein [Dyadobacter sp. Leaf189]KQS33848.1 hypothetical protein ASG33_07340 [Dyadobacter sp. Leaf189]